MIRRNEVQPRHQHLPSLVRHRLGHVVQIRPARLVARHARARRPRVHVALEHLQRALTAHPLRAVRPPALRPQELPLVIVEALAALEPLRRPHLAVRFLARQRPLAVIRRRPFAEGEHRALRRHAQPQAEPVPLPVRIAELIHGHARRLGHALRLDDVNLAELRERPRRPPRRPAVDAFQGELQRLAHRPRDDRLDVGVRVERRGHGHHVAPARARARPQHQRHMPRRTPRHQLLVPRQNPLAPAERAVEMIPHHAPRRNRLQDLRTLDVLRHRVGVALHRREPAQHLAARLVGAEPQRLDQFARRFLVVDHAMRLATLGTAPVLLPRFVGEQQPARMVRQDEDAFAEPGGLVVGNLGHLSLLLHPAQLRGQVTEDGRLLVTHAGAFVLAPEPHLALRFLHQDFHAQLGQHVGLARAVAAEHEHVVGRQERPQRGARRGATGNALARHVGARQQVAHQPQGRRLPPARQRIELRQLHPLLPAPMQLHHRVEPLGLGESQQLRLRRNGQRRPHRPRQRPHLHHTLVGFTHGSLAQYRTGTGSLEAR